MAVSWRTLRQLTRYSNRLKHVNRISVRALATQPQNHVMNQIVHRGVQYEFVRRYAEWAPNVVKSAHPDFEIPNCLFHEFFWSKIDKWNDLPAVVCGITGRELKYSEVRKLTRKLATSLLKEGFKPGQVIAVVLPNMLEFPVVALGIIEAGLILSPINPIYTADEIAYQVKDSSAAAIITIPNRLDAVLEAKEIVRRENKENESNIRIICTPDVFGKEIDLPTGVERYSRFVGDNVDETALPSLQTKDRTQNDVMIIPYSSGTTGRPKGVCLTHVNLMSSILNFEGLEGFDETSNGKQEVLPCILPGFHIYGFTIVMGAALYYGAKIIMIPKFDEKLFLHILTKYKPTVLHVAPPLVIYLGAHPNVTKEHLQSLKLIVCGAAPCAHSDIQKCVDKSPPSLQYIQGYGLTETSPAVCLMMKKSNKYSSVGGPLPRTTVKVADLMTGQALGPDEEGEICVKGPQVMKGYLNNEKANAEVFDSEGWFHTGDIGYYDKDKHFYITDRLKELIKVKGFQVAPAELEAVLRSHPAVEDAGVIGVPDPRKGETPIGFIKVKNGATVTEEELTNFLAQKVAKYKQIEKFVFVDGIPKSAAGKILRKDLKQNFLDKVNLDNYLKEKQN